MFLFFWLQHFWKAEVVPLAFSIAVVIRPLSFLATTQVSRAKTSLCGWVRGWDRCVRHLGRCASLVTLCRLGCDPGLGPGMGLWEAISLHGGEREGFCGISNVLSSQQESLVRNLCFAVLRFAKGQNKF